MCHHLVICSFAYHLCKVFRSPCFLYNRKKRLFRIKHIEFLFRIKKNDSILYVADLTVLGKGSTILNTCATWMYWCIKTINYLEASTLNDQLIKEGLETLRSCPLRNFWRETALLIDVMWPGSNQYKTAVLRKKIQLYNKIMSLFCTYYSKGKLPETLA